MKAIVRGQTIELRVSTVTLQPQEQLDIYAFHCPNCGNFLQQVGGKVSKIYPFYEPTREVLVVSRCKTCGTRYNFQTFDYYASDKIKVILHPTNTTNYFFCANSKDKILEFAPDRAITIKDNKKHGFPFTASCPLPECKRIYWFSEMLY
ncbi:MAG TPA: hypothetical protein VF941_02930 [Clostridia bacterium]